MIVIFLSLNAVCSLLTTIEFIIATLVIFSFRPVLHGLWLFKLHRRKVLQLQVPNNLHQTIALEAIGLLIGAWFALLVTLTEYRLEDGVYSASSQPEVVSRYCAFMNATYDYYLMLDARPPLQFFVDSMSLDIAELHSCRYGIDHLDFGTVANNSEQEDSILIPNCVPQLRATELADMSWITFQVDLIDAIAFEAHSNLTYILTYATQSVGLSYREDIGYVPVPLPPIEECATRNISSMPTVFGDWWHTRDMDNLNVSRSLLQRLCGTMDETAKPLNATFVNSSNCFTRTAINTECLRAYIRSGSDSNAPSTYSITFADVSTLIVQDNDDSSNRTTVSTVCVDASVRYEYVLLSRAAIKVVGTWVRTSIESEVHNESRSEFQSFVIPLRMRVLSGSCERTVSALGLSALIYSTKVDWHTLGDIQYRDRLKGLSRQQRLHAYMISMARHEFPFYKLGNWGNLPSECTFEMASSGTKIQTDAVFVLLVVSLSVCSFIIFTAAIFSFVIPKHTWEVAKFALNVTMDDLDLLVSSNGIGGSDEYGKEAGDVNTEQAAVQMTFKRNSPGVCYEQHAIVGGITTGTIVVMVEREAVLNTNNNSLKPKWSYRFFGHSNVYKVNFNSRSPK